MSYDYDYWAHYEWYYEPYQHQAEISLTKVINANIWHVSVHNKDISTGFLLAV